MGILKECIMGKKGRKKQHYRKEKKTSKEIIIQKKGIFIESIKETKEK